MKQAGNMSSTEKSLNSKDQDNFMMRAVNVIMCSVNPEYKPYVRTENGKKVLYLRVLKAIYGCIESALLWCDLYSTTLQNMGFDINQVDRCVSKKLINGKQCTIAFYVDNNKVSHVDPKVNDEAIEEIKNYFGDLTITWGKKHVFLGMYLEITNDKKIEMHMNDQCQEAIDAFGEDVTSPTPTPAAAYLYKTCEEADDLNDEQSEIFHLVTQNLL